MHLRNLVAAGALALACMLSVSGAFAAPTIDLVLDTPSIVDRASPADFMIAVTAPAAEPLLGIASTAAADEADGYCDGLGDAALSRCLDQLFGLTFHRYDPGWRSS